MLNLFEIVERAAERWPHSVALVQDERVFTYESLYQAICSIAEELAGIGVARGDKVGVVFPRSIEYVLSCFAVLKSGAIAVPISAVLKAQEIAAAAAAVDIDAFCCHENLRSTLADTGITGTESLSRSPAHPSVAITRILKPQNLIMRERLLAANAAYICFSSGTTSVSKGIVLSHEALFERANRRVDVPKTTPESCILWLRAFDRFVPNQIVAAFMLGAKTIIGSSLDRRSLPRLIMQHGVNQVWAVPSFYRSLLQDSVPATDYDSVPYFLSSGAPLPAPVSQAFYDKFHREIMQNYGSAECSPIFMNSGTARQKRGSVGTPVEGREVRLRSFDSNIENASEGELLVRGSGMLCAYYNPWRYPDEFLQDGWLPTGDIARRDEDGYYWIIGRIKEIINVGGTKVFASELEEIISRHPGVEDCVVLGVADPRFGEVPHAKVKLRGEGALSEVDLLRFVNDRVSVFKSLRKLEFVDHIEKTATGKPKRWLYRLVALPAPFFKILSTAAPYFGADAIL